MRDIATRSRDEEIDELALRAGETTGDIGQGLLEYAEQQKGTEVGERTLHAAFMTYRDKHDLVKMHEVAFKLLTEYPKSKLAAAELLTLAKAQTDAVDYEGSGPDLRGIHQKPLPAGAARGGCADVGREPAASC